MKNYKDAQFIYDCLEAQFKPDQITDIFPKKGLQFHNTDRIWKVYTATFANPTVIDEIIRRGDEEVMLFTHHPLPPMKQLVNGYSELSEDDIRRMKEHRITLFSYHIPLDVAGPYAPGNTLGKALGANVYDSFYPQNGADIGALCVCGLTKVSDLAERMEKLLGHPVKLYHYGSEELQGGKFAILAGCAKNPNIYQWLKEHGINTFVTGTAAPVVEWTQKNHAAAKEHGINILSGTHCSTEKFAPKEMCTFFRNLGVEAEFIDEEPNLDEL
jgi:putative NIF3 family GTP cyclohydrolase 1 type 2